MKHDEEAPNEPNEKEAHGGQEEILTAPENRNAGSLSVPEPRMAPRTSATSRSQARSKARKPETQVGAVAVPGTALTRREQCRRNQLIQEYDAQRPSDMSTEEFARQQAPETPLQDAEVQLPQEPVENNDTTLDNKRPWYQRRRRLILLFAVLIVVGIVVGVVVAVTGGSDNQNAGTNNGAPSTAASTPSPAPTATLQPTLSGQWTPVGEAVQGQARNGELGRSVSLSSNGTIMAVGSPLNDANGDASGLVQVLRLEGGQWAPMGQNFTGQARDELGRALSLSGDGTMVAVGVGGHKNFTGRVDVYRFNGQEWDLELELEGDNEFDHFGHWSLALSEDGNTVAAGAIQGKLGNVENKPGYVRVLRLVGGEWQPQGDALSGQEVADEFGFSVTLSTDGNHMAVGAPRNDASGDNAGQVRVFSFDEQNKWIQLGGVINGTAAMELSGGFLSMSASGKMLAVGSRLNDNNGRDSGHVRVYNFSDQEEWVLIGQELNGAREFEEFGVPSLSSDGNVVAIGAPGSSYANVYRLDGERWKQLGQSLVGDGRDGIWFGEAVSLASDGKTVAVGAPRSTFGNVYVYQLE